jgi:AcrR family transcriptional regulator
MAATRLPSRKERQAQTRALLMRSAARVAARRGLEAASVDEVAREAGFTKGAVYANFESKEDLFLSMLDERFGERLRDIDRVLREGGTPEEQARRAASDFIASIGAAPEWERLFFEFAVYAARHEDFRRRLVRRYRDLRERIAELLARRAEELGIEPALPPEQVAAMTFAMTNGMALERLLEPEAVPDDLYPAMMATFFAGLQRR